MKYLGGFAFLLLLVGCGGGGGQSDSVAAICQSQCDREQRCGSGGGDSCVAGCMDGAPLASIFKPGILSAWATCLSKLQCGVSDDECMGEVIVSQDPSYEQNPKFQACLARHDECGATGSGTSFLDDQCVAYFLCTSQVTAQIDACLAGVCDGIAACLDAVLHW